MKLARFDAGRGAELGLVTDAGIVSISRALPQIGGGMTDLIRRWDEVRADVAALAGRPADAMLDRTRLLAPVERPGKVMAIGLNYADHIAESGLPTPTEQTWFAKMGTAVNGPNDPIQVPKVSEALDYEAEMVFVVGRGGRHIAREDAARAVFGYCVGNDVSVRDWQMATSQWLMGKSFDTHAPFGPWITTADEVLDPHVLDIRCTVNGELRQLSNTRHLVFDVWDQVAHLSKAMTLEPGDVVYTGTPAGVGMAMTPRTWLKAGDRVRVEITGLGVIEAECRAE
ncbi:MAG TPA: fumarylacetoacetate hydrolase family protein [Caulobacteraceae bacterium]|nr:fumarylacetoacetate hydrolase family protein [Caulobacteraceae bacterium]